VEARGINDFRGLFLDEVSIGEKTKSSYSVGWEASLLI